MDTDLKCNRLTCRKSLTDKAVVTTCSHIFCVECANELFTAARLCPACETALTEPDDVVVCSLRPSNDYKTSVLSGLSPSIILEICSRAISFWQYQIHQENSFQQAVVRNLTDKNAQLQKQLDNVVREANGEINLLNDKTNELQRELELERRKTRDLQEAQRERDKEYQKLKAHFDKLKRKALLPSATPDPMAAAAANAGREDYQHARQRNFGGNPGNSVNIEEVVGGMEASGIQRTPLVARTANAFAGRTQSVWMNQQQQVPQQAQQRHKPHRQSFVAQHDSGNINGSHPGNGNVSYSGNVSDRSESMHDADSVREMLMPGQQQQPRHSMTAQQGLSTNQAGSWGRAMSSATRPRMQSNAFPASASRSAGVFRPSRVPR